MPPIEEFSQLSGNKTPWQGASLLFVSAAFIVLYSYAVKMEAGRKPLTLAAAEVKDFSATRQSPLSLFVC